MQGYKNLLVFILSFFLFSFLIELGRRNMPPSENYSISLAIDAKVFLVFLVALFHFHPWMLIHCIGYQHNLNRN